MNVYTALDDAAGCSAPVTQAFTCDGDANMTGDGTWTYVWDWENRLREARAASPVEGSKKLVFRYDYMNRRIRKEVFTYDATAEVWRTTPESDTRFIYDGWNVVLELDALDDNAVIRKYTWGLDLSGTRQSAGGIGGLLGIHDETSSDDFLAFSDSNGNVGQLFDWPASIGQSSPVIAAKYEYDAYGNTVVSAGTYGATNPFRFSTKYCDGGLDAGGTADDLYCFGYRYYRPEIGRWISRDPIEELGGEDLTAFCFNNPIDTIDPLGLNAADPLFPPGSNGRVDLTRAQYDKLTKECGIRQTSNRRCLLDRGCIGITQACQGQKCSEPDFPENFGNTKCYLKENEARGRKCAKCERGVVFSKQGEFKDGRGRAPQPNADGSIPNDSVQETGGRAGIFNYVTLVRLRGQRCYVWANHAVAYGPQIITICERPCNDPDHYPDKMWCKTCVAKKQSRSTTRPTAP